MAGQGLDSRQMSKTFSGIIFSFLLSFALSASAWQKVVRFDRFSTDDGLPHAFVHSITQDEYGLIWIGTADGVAQFDGYRFRPYPHDPDDPSSSPGGVISDLYVDRQGDLWLAGAGLSRYQRRTDRFEHYEKNPEDPEALGDDVITMLEDGDGGFWLGTWNNGLNFFDRETKTFSRFTHDPEKPYSIPPGPVRALYQSTNGALWVGTYTWDDSSNLSRFDRETKSFIPVIVCGEKQSGCARPESPQDKPEVAAVAAVIEDASGDIWIGGQGLIHLNTQTNTYRRYVEDPDSPGSQSISNFTGDWVLDASGLLWFGDTYSGLYSFDPDTEALTRYAHDPAEPDSLSTNDLFTIFQDRDGLIWVATYFGGLNRFDPQALKFGYYRHQPDDATSLARSRIDALVEDSEGHIWVAAGGLNRIDREIGRVKLYEHDPDNPESLRSNDIRSLLFDANGYLWIGSPEGLERLDTDTDELIHFPLKLDPDDESSATVLSISAGVDGELWLGSSRAISRFDTTTGEFSHFFAADDGDAVTPAPGPRGKSFELFGTRDGSVWVASWAHGVSRLDPVTGTFTHFDHDPERPESIGAGLVTAFMEDATGGIWMALDTGLDRFDTATGSFRHFGPSAGVPAGFVEAIVEDREGGLWLATNGSGLVRFNPETGETRRFSIRDGLQGDNFRAGIASRTGQIVLGGNDGMNIFDPSDLPPRRDVPEVVITQFRLMNQPVEIGGETGDSPLKENIILNPSITLTHRDYLLSFEFAAVNAFDADHVRYAYMLEGLDETWIETGSDNRIATYTSLPSGQYNFRVKAWRGHPANWSNRSATLRLTILPPLWRTSWAYAAYVLLFLMLITALLQWRTRYLRQQAATLEQEVERRTREVRDSELVIRHQADKLRETLESRETLYANISHEFRTPLTLILGPVRRILGSDNGAAWHDQLAVVQRNGERLLRLVDQLLNLSRLGAKPAASVEPRRLGFSAQALIESFQPVAEDKGVKLAVGQLDDVWVRCAADAFEQILMNLLSNAIKYTPAGGEVELKIRGISADHVEIAVRDTGIGIPASEHDAIFERFYRLDKRRETVSGAGIGLALVKELVGSCGGEVKVASAPGEGATFTVTLPRAASAELASDDRPSVRLSPSALREIRALAGLGTSLKDDGIDAESRRYSVLIVEDNPDMQDYLVQLLGADYECLVAGNGADGFEMALEQIPDIVVSDVLMPEMDGFELTQALKEDQRTSHIPIIMLTALSDRESRLKGLREKADDYLIKPFDDEELILRIANQLASREILRIRYAASIYRGEKSGPEFNARDRLFMERFEALLDGHFSDAQLDTEKMASKMAVSTRQLQRKFKALTGHSPVAYLRSYRLNKAAERLVQGEQISQVALEVGFSSPGYFTTCFKARFGMTPSEFQEHSARS